MSYWTDLTNTLRFKHAENAPAWMKKAQKWSNMPGSPVSLMKALEMGEWSNPYSSGQNSYDTFAGGGSATKPWARGIGRAVGSYFAGRGISDVTDIPGLGKGIMGLAKGGGGAGGGAGGGGLMGLLGGGQRSPMRFVEEEPIPEEAPPPQDNTALIQLMLMMNAANQRPPDSGGFSGSGGVI